MARVLPWIIWAVVPLTKANYAFIAFSRESASFSLSVLGDNPVTLLGVALALLITFAGVVLARTAFQNPERLPAFLREFSPSRRYPAGLTVLLPWIVALGLLEAVATFGLVWSLREGTTTYFILGAGLSLAGWALSFPRPRPANE